jgi:hypothetical protein
VKPTIPEVLPMVRAYYAKEGNGNGGSLHIVLGDGNTQNSHVAFCLEQAEANEDEEGASLARLLLQMSRTQRRKLYLAGLSGFSD